ncbi:hypothetical protein LZ30DRAFT_368650 [Colletotrichum cereale]|nr:hypothetical protein LZ30DRAFT_368650 [Colletotrichum cereale]
MINPAQAPGRIIALHSAPRAIHVLLSTRFHTLYYRIYCSTLIDAAHSQPPGCKPSSPFPHPHPYTLMPLKEQTPISRPGPRPFSHARLSLGVRSGPQICSLHIPARMAILHHQLLRSSRQKPPFPNCSKSQQHSPVWLEVGGQVHTYHSCEAQTRKKHRVGNWPPHHSLLGRI